MNQAELHEASKTQVGGSHYKDMPIQPAEFCQKNKLPFCESAVVKYICRHKNKHGAEDIKKAIHFLHLLLEWEYPTTPQPTIPTDIDLAVYLRQEIEERDGYHFPAITVEATWEELNDKQIEEHYEWLLAEYDSFHQVMEMWDRIQAGETWLRRKAAEGVDIQAAKDAVYRKNLERGYYK